VIQVPLYLKDSDERLENINALIRITHYDPPKEYSMSVTRKKPQDGKLTKYIRAVEVKRISHPEGKGPSCATG